MTKKEGATMFVDELHRRATLDELRRKVALLHSREDCNL